MGKNYVAEIEELNKSKVHIKNPEYVNKVINEIVQGGFPKLQIVSDFDKTITKQHVNGKKHHSSFGMFNMCPSVPDNYKTIATKLTNKYYPLEVDPTIPIIEKTKLMEEWWSLSEEALKGLVVPPSEIEETCAKLQVPIRDGSKELFDTLYKEDVPVLVFSAGLGDTVTAVLKYWDVMTPNMKVTSNFLKYDQNGQILGFQDPAIHVYNKNEYAIKGTSFYDMVADRTNVILMGDSLGDAKMDAGMSHADAVLRIGFLYERSEEALPSYMDHFDIVLNDDQTMNVVQAILKQIQ